MQELTHIGLDVHKETIAVAVLRPGDERVRGARDREHARALRKLFSRYPDRAALRACYEAGPTGYDTWRLLSDLGVPCEVIAPSLIHRRSGAHVKTDRSDARNLARLHRAAAPSVAATTASTRTTRRTITNLPALFGPTSILQSAPNALDAAACFYKGSYRPARMGGRCKLWGATKNSQTRLRDVACSESSSAYSRASSALRVDGGYVKSHRSACFCAANDRLAEQALFGRADEEPTTPPMVPER